MKIFLWILASLALLVSCSPQKSVFFHADFNQHDRVWIGSDFLTIPLEDWRIQNGRLECIGDRKNMRANLLTYTLGEQTGDFTISTKMGLLQNGADAGYGGFAVGLWDDIDNSVKSLCYFGYGMQAGVSNTGILFLHNDSTKLADDFDLQNFTLTLQATVANGVTQLQLTAEDTKNHAAGVTQAKAPHLHGLVAIVNKNKNYGDDVDAPKFWFDDFSISGTKINHQPENAFGPILWSMYTNSRNVLKLTAQMPPLGVEDNQTVELQLYDKGWQTIATTTIDPDAYTATFRLENWDASRQVDYRVAYTENDSSIAYYTGKIQRDPIDRPLVMGGLTCQEWGGFPYTPVVKNLAASNPDLLYFSGDQIYEGNGGYGIIRFPDERAILNYLGKWYMFGWAFGDVMRDRPTVCTPDDHDVFQGNLWGQGGVNNPIERWNKLQDCSGGFVEPARMVNVVNRTQCSHLPDPYDHTPLYQNIIPFYTHMVYGNVSFAIITDRIFKSGPEHIAFWDGRLDHLTEILPNPDVLDREDLKFLGDRQIDFLQHWITDWRGANMKVVLSQTIFTNSATHHGPEKMFLEADLDSGGWPKSGRDKAIKLMRKAFAFQIAGDQHIPSLIQYGVEHFRDANWVFCTPAISVGYERRFVPDQLGWPVENRPAHQLPNTGYYHDGFGNKNYVYAIGNPLDTDRNKPRYIRAQEKASGFGIIRFDTEKRTISTEAWHFLADLNNPKDMFDGWPKTINQLENYGAYGIAPFFLPSIHLDGADNAVLMVYDQQTDELIYSLRIVSSFQPRVFKEGEYRMVIGIPEKNTWQEFPNLHPGENAELQISF